MRLPTGFNLRLLGFVAVFSVGLGLRLASIRESLWLDELSTLWAVEASFAEVIRRVPQVMGQSPFYFAIVWASLHTFGQSELALRLPSLLAGMVCPTAIAMVASSLGGRRAAAWSFVFFWLCYPAIWTSVDARPYAVAMCFGAVATLGFTRACLRGRRQDRALWIAGAAGLVWTHYVFLPFLLAYPAGYLVGRRARGQYPPKSFLTDAALIGALLLPAIPQLAGIVSDRRAQAWMFGPKHLGMTGQLVPFVLAMVFPSRGRRDEAVSEVRRTLWFAVVAQLAAIEAAQLFGLDLVSTRYASVTIVAAAILAGENVARLTGADIIAPAAVFVLSTAIILFATDRVAGSYSGAGYQEWRQAVAALRPELERAVGAPVLFRSGNAEDDLGIPGQLTWPATLAPLRSPGSPAPHWNIILLTYRWQNPLRPAYFQEVVQPRLDHQRVFFLLCLRSDEPDSNGYCDNVESWIRQQWLGQFQATSLGLFRQLSVLRFDRRG